MQSKYKQKGETYMYINKYSEQILLFIILLYTYNKYIFIYLTRIQQDNNIIVLAN